jgi:carbamoyl-phosphate synthase small subunit
MTVVFERLFLVLLQKFFLLFIIQKTMKGKLLLSDGTEFFGELYGKQISVNGEVVFNTGMTGYEQSLSDPSYRGQILTFTYPLIGNYGIASEKKDTNDLAEHFESEGVHVRGVIVGELSEKFSHHSAEKSLSDWLNEKGIPLLSGVDTRALTQKLREHGVMLGQIVPEGQEALPEVPDPNEENLVAEVSCKAVQILEPDDFCGITIAAIDTGIKNNILRSFLRRGVRIIRCPWDADISKLEHDFDALFLSNGPGDPEAIADVVGKNIHFARSKKMPVFGICLGNQILALACGAKTYKMKYGHRGVNQPCQDMFTKKAVITSQNHGFAVDADSLPEHFEVWFTNLNDGSVEGIRHTSEPIFSVIPIPLQKTTHL